MSQKNTLTIGGGAAGGMTAIQLANDLALLTVEGICSLDNVAGCQAALDIYEAELRVAGVLWAVAITIAAAAIGRFIAGFVEPAKPSATV